MARLSHTFTMSVTPAEAQAMFLRDIWPELAKDGEFRLYSQAPGLLRFSQGIIGSEESLEDLADPDVVGHAEEDDEPAATAAEEAQANPVFMGTGGIGVRPQPQTYSRLRYLISRRLKVIFTAIPQGTSVEIKGSAEKLLAQAINRLGSPGHWPETANDPHN